MKPYLICATPRTGTNLLCEALLKTGVAGRPDEYFGYMHEARWKAEWNVDLPNDYIERVTFEASTGNGVWGVKIMMQYFDDLYALLQQVFPGETVDRFAAVERAFGKLNYVWMTRRDKLDQAISLHKANQNFVWTVERGVRFPDERNLIFDSREIDRIRSEIAKHEEDWERYFESVECRPYVIIYEDFIENYQATVNGVLHQLGIQHSIEGEIDGSRFQRQRNQLSEKWRNRYLREKQDAQQGNPA